MVRIFFAFSSISFYFPASSISNFTFLFSSSSISSSINTPGPVHGYGGIYYSCSCQAFGGFRDTFGTKKDFFQ